MRVSQLLLSTLREVPAEAETASHRLMLKAGLIRKLVYGIYAFLPLGLKVLRKIENIVREEMDRAGAQELLMPALLPAAQEDVFAGIAKNEIRSYRALPKILYQIQSRYRDEARPRFGVIRSREFLMKEACSFDRDEEGLNQTYKSIYDTYCRIFSRCGLDCITVEAASGAMGGSGSLKYLAMSDIDDACAVICDTCGYAADVEIARCKPLVCNPPDPGASVRPAELTETPDAGTIEELVKFFGCSPDRFAKTLILKADGRIVAAMVRGDRELNMTKLQNHLGCLELQMADAATVMKVTGAEVGFAGPVSLAAGTDILMDSEVALMDKMIVGANKTGCHRTNVVYGRDFKAKAVLDLRTFTENDRCPECGASVRFIHGIETAHVCKPGEKYGSKLGCTYLDEEGKERPMAMGCYGIGINKVMAAVIEQHNDENGIIWPVSIAPYPVIITLINPADPVQTETAGKLYDILMAEGIEALLDDRDERAGVKFKDADLIGIPVRLTVGKKAAEGFVEYKERAAAEKSEMSLTEALEKVKGVIAAR